MGMTARLAPQRESVIAQPLAPRSPVAQPSPDLMTRRVYSRTAPPPPPVTFSARQQSHVDNPGRPLDPEALLRLQRTQPSAVPTVTMVSPSKAQRAEPPAGRQEPVRVTPPPAVRQPAVTDPGNRGSSDVAAQITTLRTRSLPNAEQRLAAARGVAGIRLDFNSVARQLSAAREALAGAERDLAGGNAGRAQQTVAAVQRQIEDQMRLISAAIQAAK